MYKFYKVLFVQKASYNRTNWDSSVDSRVTFIFYLTLVMKYNIFTVLRHFKAQSI